MITHRFALLLTAVLTSSACIPDTDAEGCLAACELRLEAEECANQVEICFDSCADVECIESCITDRLIPCITAEANDGSDELVACAAACVGDVEDEF